MAKVEWQSQKKDLEFYLPKKKEYRKFLSGKYVSNTKEEEDQLNRIEGVKRITPIQQNTMEVKTNS